MHKGFGVAFLAAGLMLLVCGRQIADSFGSHIDRVFTGATTDRVTFLYIGGVVLVMIGLFQLFWPNKMK